MTPNQTYQFPPPFRYLTVSLICLVMVLVSLRSTILCQVLLYEPVFNYMIDLPELYISHLITVNNAYSYGDGGLLKRRKIRSTSCIAIVYNNPSPRVSVGYTTI